MKHSSARFVLLTVMAALSTTNCMSISRNNPFDDKAPATVRARGGLSGRVLLESGTPGPDVIIVAAAVRAAGVAGRREQVSPAADGLFLLELPDDTYNLEITAPGHRPVGIPNITVRPGLSVDFGLIAMNALRVAVAGRVLKQTVARAVEGAAGAQVVLERTDGTAGSIATLAGTDGSYRAEGVPAGTYLLRAALDEYAPGYLSTPLVVGAEGDVTTPELTLFPASAVLHFRVGSDVSPRFTRTRDVSVELLAFVEQLTEMRVSLDPLFTESTQGDVSYRAFAAESAITLADADGEQQAYAQFRDVNGRESDVFFASIVLDRTPPEVLALTVGNGGIYLTADIASVSIQGVDDISGVAGYRLALDGTLNDEPTLPLSAGAGAVTVRSVESFGVTEGPRALAVELVDRAGNVSAVTTLDIIKDTLSPLPGSPPVSLVGGGTVASALSVPLLFDVAGRPAEEAIYVQLSNAPGISAAIPKQLVTGPLNHTLLAGPDGARDLCVVFSDAAGNQTAESCVTLTLDRDGDIQGTARLSTGTDFSGVTINLSSVTQVYTDSQITGASGAFSFADVPAGDDWVLTFSRTDYESLSVAGLTVQGGRMTNVSPQLLRLLEGGLSGSVNKQGEATHSGIAVTATRQGGGTPLTRTTLSNPDGSWRIDGLLAGTYSVSASAEGFIASSYGSQVVVAFTTSAIPATLTLSGFDGDFNICAASDVGCTQPLSATRSTSVRLGINCASLDAESYYASESATPPVLGQMIGCAPAPTFTLSGGDGSKVVRIWYYDSDTATFFGPFASSVLLDTTPPSISALTLDAGAAYTRSLARAVTVSLSASDGAGGSGVAFMDVNNTDCAQPASGYAASETTFPTPAPRLSSYAASTLGWVLDGSADPVATDGTKTVCAQVCDLAGNCSESVAPTSATIILDRIAPSAGTGVGFVIDNASPTSQTSLSLTVTVGDATSYRYGLSNDLSLFGYLPLAASDFSFEYTVPSQEGTRDVFMQFKDAAGNESTVVSDSVVIDRTPPTSPSLTVTALDTSPTPAVGWTRSRAVRLDVSVTGATEAQWSNVLSFDGAETSAWTALVSGALTVASWNLSDADGERPVYARFRDSAGNVSATTSAVIRLDRQAPAASSLVIANGDAYSQTNSVLTALSGFDTQTPTASLVMRYSRNGLFDETVPPADYASITYAPTRTYDLQSGVATTGTKTIYARLRDLAGNESTSVSDSIALDLAAPAWGGTPVVLRDRDSLSTTLSNDVVVDVILQATDDTSGTPVDMSLSENAAFSGAAWVQFQTTSTFPLSSVNGAKTLYVRTRDASGRISSTQSASIDLDTTPPVITSFIPSRTLTTASLIAPLDLAVTVGDNLVARAPQIRLALSNSAPNCSTLNYDALFVPPACTATGGAATKCTSAVTCSAGSCAATLTNWLVSVGADGARTIYVCARDEAGNVTSSPALAQVNYDAAAPTNPTGLFVTTEPRVAHVSWLGSTDANGVAGYNVEWAATSDFASGIEGTSFVSATTTDIPLRYNSRPYWFRVQARDNAGRTSSASPVFPSSAFSDSGLAAGLREVQSFAWGSADVESVEVVGTKLWVAHRVNTLDLDPLPNLGSIQIRSCDWASSDCAVAASWVSIDTALDGDNNSGSMTYIDTPRIPIMATPTHLVVSYPIGSEARWAMCARTTNCLLSANWLIRTHTNVSLVTSTRASSLYNNGRHLVAMYSARSAADMTLADIVLEVCRLDADCTSAASWSLVRLETQVMPKLNHFDGRDTASLWFSDSRVFIGFGGAIRNSVPPTYTHAQALLSAPLDTFPNDDDTVWTRSLFEQVSGNSLAIRHRSTKLGRVSNRFLMPYIFNTSPGSGTDRVYTRTCDLATAVTGCADTADWVTSLTDITDLPSVTARLTFSTDADEAWLGVAVVTGGNYRMRAHRCLGSATVNCQTRTQWAPLELGSGTYIPAAGPLVVNFGASPLFFFRTVEDQQRLASPRVLAPIDHSAGPGFFLTDSGGISSGISSEWVNLVPAGDTTVFNYDTDGPPQWSQSVPIDASLSSLQFLVSGTNFTSLTSSRDQRLSDDARAYSVRSFGQKFINSNLSGESTVGCHAEEASITECFPEQIAAAGGRRAITVVKGSNHTVSVCTSNCSTTSGNYTTTSLDARGTMDATGYSPAVGAARFHLAGRRLSNNNVQYKCQGGAVGCASFSTTLVISSGGATGGAPVIAAHPTLARVFVLWQTSGGQMTVASCADANDCTLIGNWTSYDVGPTLTGTPSGLRLVASSSGLTIIRENETRLQRFYCSTASSCDAAGDWTAVQEPIVVSAGDAILGNSSMLAIDPTGEHHHMVYIENKPGGESDQLMYATCRVPNGSTDLSSVCHNSASWQRTRLFPAQLRAAESDGGPAISQVSVNAEKVNAIYSEQNKLYLLTCSGSCENAKNWHRTVMANEPAGVLDYPVSNRPIMVSETSGGVSVFMHFDTGSLSSSYSYLWVDGATTPAD